MPNNMDFFDFLSQHSLEDVLSAIIQYQLENLMHDGEQLSLAEYAAANALYACPQNGISPLTRNCFDQIFRHIGVVGQQLLSVFRQAVTAARCQVLDNKFHKFLFKDSSPTLQQIIDFP